MLKKLKKFKVDREDINLLSDEQKVELDKRLRLYKTGKVSFSLWEEAKARIRNEAADGI